MLLDLNINIYFSTLFAFIVFLLPEFLIYFKQLKLDLINFDIKKLSSQICIPTIFLLITMYIFGYFEVPFTDSLAYGYGIYKTNLASIISPIFHGQGGIVNWSLFLPEIPMTLQEKNEGFSYLGIGGIFLLTIGIFFIFFNVLKNHFWKFRLKTA